MSFQKAAAEGQEKPNISRVINRLKYGVSSNLLCNLCGSLKGYNVISQMDECPTA